MEKKQYELCREVLRRLDQCGLLNNLIMIGSWCLLFYKDYFQQSSYRAAIRTRDLDFLIPLPQRFAVKVDLHDLLRDLGFVINFKGQDGWITLQHPDLIIEFLIPERGRGTHKPVLVPDLGVNAQSLRFLDFLATDTIRVRFHDLILRVPHPANFALHKLIIASRRQSDKGERDRSQAVQVLQALIQSGEKATIRARFSKAPAKWQTCIRKNLAEMKEDNILAVLV
ncbi:MAG: nucleotidyltransferase domain-containing protein [Verrucomicrobia bacterium]|nr:nucleotidyltransferase domain-containing protein [Verrucomicrobiota bacterium]MBU1735824.1 nucleotidyltransferase domain-containing protein [Verrucomicrobiota bacterium]MBU1855513.1 nucleotidyltransferase domain-containing protein [Verrucomicrobiota bacterium]